MLKGSDMSKLMPSCKEAHRLVSEQMDRKLSMVERSGLRVHLAVCEACTRFSGQMDLLRRAMRTPPPGGDQP